MPKRFFLFLMCSLLMDYVVYAQHAKTFCTEYDDESNQWIMLNETSIQDLKILDKLSKNKNEKWIQDSIPKLKIYEDIQKLKKYKVFLFLGTWCFDSKMLVPQYLYLFSKIDTTLQNVFLYALNRKKNNMIGLTSALNVTHLPTLILFDETGKEQLRIVEYGTDGWQKDLELFLKTLK